MSPGALLENPYSRTRDRGREGYAVTHRIVGNLFMLCLLATSNGFSTHAPRVIDAILGGWQLSALGTLQTGLWFTPMFSGADTTGTGASTGRPDRLGNGSLPSSQQSIFGWFDKTAFAIPSAGNYGNSGRGIRARASVTRAAPRPEQGLPHRRARACELPSCGAERP